MKLVGDRRLDASKKLHGAKKLSGDRTGLGYNSNEGSTTETSSTPRLERTKFKTMNFVKSNTEQLAEAKSDKDKIATQPQIWQGRFCGLRYTAPEKSCESWLNKIIAQMLSKSRSGGIKQGQPLKLKRRIGSTGHHIVSTYQIARMLHIKLHLDQRTHTEHTNSLKHTPVNG
ncbi:aldehyde dehydrogenase (NAD+) [Dorcoceras hygrometricum]|uniref:Aldehyde dehydrogenase (NAD+) n=1 Tax=Dorcoceras hygrometricum TaxID=472368 RepID=A0A2Z7D6Y8_9LAMI|nr:aldehyde dehydrogenase (NAD+) [Dorcoceras hygrometricum]